MVGFTVAAAALAKNDAVEVNGSVQAMPAGLVGIWTIAGTTVRTDGSTQFKQEVGALAIGALVEVQAMRASDGVLLAQRIEVKQSAVGTTPPVGNEGEVSGLVQSLPQGGVVGTWTVAGHTIHVVSATQIDQERGGIAVGANVEVHGTTAADGSITASRVEVLASAAPPHGTDDLGVEDLLGTIEALPAETLVGTWRIAGISIAVDASTVLDAEHGAFAIGTLVEVTATAKDGKVRATRIESKPGQGAPVAPVRYWGHIAQLPSAPFTGLWKVDDTIVTVQATTELHVDAGPFALGAIVEVSGWAQADGTTVAREITTRSSVGAMAGQTSRAVEFRNDRLGHYFITAYQQEIAALDSGAFGGEWKRTGESFGVGGTHAVCRFYGMPPRGPDSHFFTADGAECEHVMAEFAPWTFEAHAFAIAVPDATGQCARGLVPVHRFYNQPTRTDDTNHRYTVSAQAYAETTALGWLHEGVVMCAQP
ncbi:MAG TPA: DUF5666 domain-containing protein [Casimicrobiaceae bacterium]|nr:DUF5666 domain-containing protein [Casimicrobiaceae bacterium]